MFALIQEAALPTNSPENNDALQSATVYGGFEDEGVGVGYGGFPNPPTNANAIEKIANATQDRFLLAFAKFGNVGKASELAGISRFTVYDWIERDKREFRKRYRYAQDAYADSREQLMHERLANPEGNRGSDILLIFQQKALRPEKYRDYPPTDDSAANTLRELRKLAQTLKAEPSAISPQPSAEVIEGEEAERLLLARRGDTGGQEPNTP